METATEATPEGSESKIFRSLFSVPQIIYYIPPWSQANWSERWKLVLYRAAIYMPVIFLVSLVAMFYATYVSLYIVALVTEVSDPPVVYYWQTESQRKSAVKRGWILFGFMTAFVTLFFWSFVKASRTHPGSIPNQAEWDPNDTSSKATSVERKKDGTYRACARCVKLKPDRCHHCRLCDLCVLKMDHHCPWIANCVGFFNYKYFFLIVTYGSISLLLFTATFWEVVVVSIYDSSTSAILCFFNVMVFSLISILALATTCFWLFHISLIKNNNSTIEYCEKRRNEETHKRSPYDVSLWNNLKGALGKHPLLWLLPFGPYRDPAEDGINFRTRFDFQ